jgi:Spy/CpxP family protein refolding chaperone
VKRPRKPKIPRGKPDKARIHKLIEQFQGSGQTWGAFWNALPAQERAVADVELDEDRRYNDLIEAATPDDAALEQIRKEMAEGFAPWAAQIVARLCVTFYLQMRLEERQGGRQILQGLNRDKRTAANADRRTWLKVGEPLRKQHPAWSNIELAKRIVMKMRPGAARPSDDDPLVERIRKALPTLRLARQRKRPKK